MTVQVAKETLLSVLQPKSGPIADKVSLHSVLVPQPGPVIDKITLYAVLVPVGLEPEPQPAARRRMFVNN